MNIKILKLKQVREITSLSGPTIWRKERAGDFPVRRQISSNRVGWVETEVIDWLFNRTPANVAPKKTNSQKPIQNEKEVCA